MSDDMDFIGMAKGGVSVSDTELENYAKEVTKEEAD